MLDRGKESMVEFIQMIKNDCGIKPRPITNWNPQTDTIIENVHQKIGNTLCTFEFKNLAEDEPGMAFYQPLCFNQSNLSHDYESLTNTISIW